MYNPLHNKAPNWHKRRWNDFYSEAFELKQMNMLTLLFLMASITGGIWCSYFVEYLEDKKANRELTEAN